MKLLSFIAGLCLVVVDANGSLENEFFRAMEDASLKRNVDILSRLVESATPSRRQLDEDSGNGIDLTSYALKYLGCQNVRQFSDNLAYANADTVLATNKFVTFRLCNAKKCSTYNKYGCNDDFGEYVIELELYLEIMEQYHYEKFLGYCASCAECMTPPDDLDDDAVYQAYNESDSAAYNETADYAWNAVNDCEYYGACANYEKACSSFDGQDDDSQRVFLQCNAFQVGDDVRYLGPHCSDDGYTISMGVFEDADCSDFIGDQIDMAYYTGMNVDNNNLDFFASPSCISCMNANSPALYNDDNEANEVYELCEYLYDSSGQCNRYMDISAEQYYVEVDGGQSNEDQVCNFVESIMENNYDEYGEIYLNGESGSFKFSNWNKLSEYKNVTRNVTGGQMFWLIASGGLCIVLFGYAAYLHSKVTRIWRPKKQYPKYPAEDYTATRSASGITMLRSRSNLDQDSFS